MSQRSSTTVAGAVLAGAAILALTTSAASAFTLAAPSPQKPALSAQVDQVRWRHGWGWGPGAVVGGLAAGALLGGYYYGPRYYGYGYGPGYYGPGYYGHCWRDDWGRLRCWR